MLALVTVPYSDRVSLERVWHRATNVIWMGQDDGAVLLLTDGAAQPVHVGPPGLSLWTQLDEPRTVADLADELDPDVPRTQLETEIDEVLTVLAGFGACQAHDGGSD